MRIEEGKRQLLELCKKLMNAFGESAIEALELGAEIKRLSALQKQASEELTRYVEINGTNSIFDA